jgi:hypothetical protein
MHVHSNFLEPEGRDIHALDEFVRAILRNQNPPESLDIACIRPPPNSFCNYSLAENPDPIPDILQYLTLLRNIKKVVIRGAIASDVNEPSKIVPDQVPGF